MRVACGFGAPTSATGYSHVHLGFCENSSWIPPVPGKYEAVVKITEPGAAGWELSVPFRVDP